MEQNPNHAPPLVEMRGIGKSFSGVSVLDDVHFELRPGEVHVLAGENGAGKSTLIKILAGVHTEFTGEVRLAGQPVRFQSPHDACRRGISVIHQEMSLVPELPVADNLFLGRERCGHCGWVDRRAQQWQARELLARLGLDLDVRRPAGEFPVAVRQLMEIAKALAFDTRILVMDEPTATLNEPEVERLFAQVRELRKRGCGIVYISHKMDEIYQIGDRATVLRDGRLIGTAPLADLSRRDLVRWLVGRDLDQQFPPRTAQPGATRLEVREFRVPDPDGGTRPAVVGVSFTAARGEILGFAGLQGSGCSELFHGLFGSFGAVVSGNVALDQQPFTVSSPARAKAAGVALLTNDRKGNGLVLGMSCTGNTTLAALPRYSPWGWRRPGAEQAATRARQQELGIRLRSLTQPVAELSGGNQQKVVLAKWLETEPRLLLLDEPTRGVDIGAKHEIYELMNRWTAAGITILLITSELPELLALADRILVFCRGCVTATFTRAEATQEAITHAAMGD